jgi:DNA-binding transcriptional LysR family regulator
MEFRQLRYFVAVAEELHFSRAAGRLHVAQPALSQQVVKLERELGVVLLARSRRRVSLTEAGRVFLVEARRVLAQAQGAVRAAKRAAAGEIGQLRVGYVDLATWLAFPELLRRYRSRYPDVDVTLTELHREPQREALQRGDLDVGFFTWQGRDRGLSGAQIALDALVVAVPEGHPLSAERRIGLGALSEEPWVMFPVELRTRFVELVLESCQAEGYTPRVVQEASQVHTLVGLVSAGIGVTLIPACIAAVPRAGVVYRPLQGESPALPLHIVWRDGELSPAAACFVELARVERAGAA